MSAKVNIGRKWLIDDSGIVAYPLIAHLNDHDNDFCDACQVARDLLAALPSGKAEGRQE